MNINLSKWRHPSQCLRAVPPWFVNIPSTFFLQSVYFFFLSVFLVLQKTMECTDFYIMTNIIEVIIIVIIIVHAILFLFFNKIWMKNQKRRSSTRSVSSNPFDGRSKVLAPSRSPFVSLSDASWDYLYSLDGIEKKNLSVHHNNLSANPASPKKKKKVSYSYLLLCSRQIQSSYPCASCLT